MTDKELRGLSRRELIEILCLLKKENMTLNEQVKQLREQLADRRLRFEKAGSLAEALASINGVLEATQKTADQYLGEIEKRHAGIEKECSDMLAKTQEECQRRQEEADFIINGKWKEFERKAEYYIQTHSELEALLESQNDKTR